MSVSCLLPIASWLIIERNLRFLLRAVLACDRMFVSQHIKLAAAVALAYLDNVLAACDFSFCEKARKQKTPRQSQSDDVWRGTDRRKKGRVPVTMPEVAFHCSNILWHDAKYCNMLAPSISLRGLAHLC